MKVLLLALFFLLVACSSFPERHGYDRGSGSYRNQKKSTEKSREVVEDLEDDDEYEEDYEEAPEPQKIVEKAPEELPPEPPKKKVVKTLKAPKPAVNAWEQAYKPWLGTPYKYGGTTKKGVDCSGFVGNMYREVRKIQLPRTSGAMYDGGSKVSRENLKEGDLVFFGSFWKVDHVGIYLNGNRFVHASTSKGVMVSPMDDVYWKPKYLGARRY